MMQYGEQAVGRGLQIWMHATGELVVDGPGPAPEQAQLGVKELNGSELFVAYLNAVLGRTCHSSSLSEPVANSGPSADKDMRE